MSDGLHGNSSGLRVQLFSNAQLFGTFLKAVCFLHVLAGRSYSFGDLRMELQLLTSVPKAAFASVELVIQAIVEKS